MEHYSKGRPNKNHDTSKAGSWCVCTYTRACDVGIKLSVNLQRAILAGAGLPPLPLPALKATIQDAHIFYGHWHCQAQAGTIRDEREEKVIATTRIGLPSVFLLCLPVLQSAKMNPDILGV